jgi:peptidoglycan/LPS O-acetylase OafA/YrhL
LRLRGLSRGATRAVFSGASVFRSWPTLETLSAGRENNLNLIRFVAASSVIFSHSYALSGFIRDEPFAKLVGISDLATVAVIAFFVISGFLVSQSATRSESVWHYAKARFLRIFPGLALTTVLAVFVIGPLATSVPLRDYFASSDTWRYLYKNLFLEAGYFLPGVFAANPVANGVNGSLWTVRVEVFLYAVVLVIWLGNIYRHRLAANLFFGACVALWLMAPDAGLPWLPANDAYMTPRFIGCFIIGAFFFVNRDRIPLSAWLALALSALVGLLVGNEHLFYPVLYLCIAYWVLIFAYHPSLQVAWFRKIGDYSYGLYVLAFPIQQLIVAKWHPIDPLRLFLLSYVLTLSVAVLSWTLVERPALALKGAPRRRAPPRDVP